MIIATGTLSTFIEKIDSNFKYSYFTFRFVETRFLSSPEEDMDPLLTDIPACIK